MSASSGRYSNMGEVFWTALRLGLTSFGGPIAHLGYFERTYVRERGWLTGEEYAGLVALCQTLPGPTSSQVGFLIGLHRAGWRGALGAWLGFTLPSATLMYAFAIFAPEVEGAAMQSVVHGLMLTAVAVVAQAVFSMARALCPDRERVGIAVLSGTALVLISSASIQLVVMLFGAVAGWILCNSAALPQRNAVGEVSPRAAAAALALYVLLLAGASGLAFLAPHDLIELSALFYRAGALVFGGGHVVLPLLQQELVPRGWIADGGFLSGYGLAQGVPGPLFTVAAYLAATSAPAHLSAIWAMVAVVSIFLPGLLLATGGMALWGLLTQYEGTAAALAGVNASVVGILAAALYDPVWGGGVHNALDVVVAVTGFAILQRWRTGTLAVAALCVIASLGSQSRIL
jgi:chromate transporter